ncbi:MAG: amidohydrolase family protein [SAR202 cluster bacterium]|nr:amidohydrolase family protein [SAR202 cluster bacterium]
MSTRNVAFKLIKAARLIDGTGAPPLERGAVLLEGDRVRAVGTWESVTAPDGAQVEEHVFEDKTVVSGLIDCHVHLNGFGDGRTGDQLNTLSDEVLTLQSAKNARVHLYSGVTTVRDCGAKNQTTLMLRKAVEMGVTVGPRMVLAGRPIAIIGGHLGYFGTEATGVDECRAAVRQLVKEGVDFIKITATGGSTGTSLPTRPSFNMEEIRAIVEEAHKFGKHVAAHCAASQGMVNALEGGVDTIIHAYHREADGAWKYRPEISERIARQGVFVNPTMHQGRNKLWIMDEKAAAGRLTPAQEAERQEGWRNHNIKKEHFAKMRQAGVRMVAGSDSSWSSYPMGSFQLEPDSYVDAGMTPMEAIVASTSDSARSCWIDDRLGTLKPGKLADMIVVDGDPSKDIRDLSKVREVFLAGEEVDRGNYV